MTALELACLTSFLRHGHEVTVYAYDRETVPPPFRWRDAQDTMPREEVFTYKSGFGAGSVSGFANMFRFALLRAHGGWWIDTDLFCLSAAWPQGDIVAAWQDGHQINNAVLRLPPYAAIAELGLAQCRDVGRGAMWSQTGPGLLTDLFHHFCCLDHALPPGSFYPIHYRNWLDLIDPGAAATAWQKLRGAYAVHLWHECMREDGVQKIVRPPRGSVLYDLIDRQDGLALFVEGDERVWSRQIAHIRERRRAIAA
jgi:hypothetical protein